MVLFQLCNLAMKMVSYFFICDSFVIEKVMTQRKRSSMSKLCCRIAPSISLLNLCRLRAEEPIFWRFDSFSLMTSLAIESRVVCEQVSVLTPVSDTRVRSNLWSSILKSIISYRKAVRREERVEGRERERGKRGREGREGGEGEKGEGGREEREGGKRGREGEKEEREERDRGKRGREGREGGREEREGGKRGREGREGGREEREGGKRGREGREGGKREREGREGGREEREGGKRGREGEKE